MGSTPLTEVGSVHRDATELAKLRGKAVASISLTIWYAIELK